MTTEPEPPDIRDALEQLILGELPELSSVEVAQTAGVSINDARRLWRALGFPDSGGQMAFTRGDSKALEQVASAVRQGLDLDTIVRMTRAVGALISRLAEWEVATVALALDEANPGHQGSADRLEASMRLVELIGPNFEELLVYAWRRHLSAAVARIELPGGDDLDLSQATVGFADVVSFTALTNELDDNEIGDLVEVFESRCHDVVAEHSGRVIKTLGDSVLFVAESPSEGIDIGLGIIAVIGGDPRLPDVHVGLATGPVVLRMGDVYGPAVNLASRLTSVARRNRVIIDERTAGMLPPAEFETRRLPARPVRGFGDIEPVAVRRTRSRHAF